MKLWCTFFSCALLAMFAPVCHGQGPMGVGGDWVGALEIRFPGPLIENAPITMQVPSDGCLESGSLIDPAATTIVRNGNSITVDFFSPLQICFSAGDPLGIWIHNQALGSFAAGSYAVTANFRYSDVGDGTPFTVLTTTMNITRGATPMATLPTLSASAAFLLSLALGLVGLIQVRRRRLRI